MSKELKDSCPGLGSRATSWRMAAVAIACLVAGVVLSHRVESGVRVEAVTLAGDTPALQFRPAGPGPYPVALLAHGYTASKEYLFRYGEALAAAGFICFSVDLPGHGASPRLYSFIEVAHTLETVARAVGPVDVFIGHSMGGFAGGEAVRQGGMSPGLFVAVGSSPRPGEHGPPLLLLTGRFDEWYPPSVLRERADARLVVSPWSNHGLELYDPLLVNAAVEAACAAVGKTPPAAPACWRWRLAGILLAVLGAFGVAFHLPGFPPRWAGVRGLLVAVILIVAFVLTTHRELDVMPHLRRIPWQIAAIFVALLVLIGAGRLRIPRWSFLALAAVVWIGCLTAGANGLTLRVSMLAPFLFAATLLGGIAACRGSRLDGDIAMAIIVGCAFFQWDQAPPKAPEARKPAIAIKLAAELCDAYVGQYRFAPDNIFRTGLELTIRREGDPLSRSSFSRITSKRASTPLYKTCVRHVQDVRKPCARSKVFGRATFLSVNSLASN